MQTLFVAEKDTFEPSVRGYRQQAVEHQVKDDVDGVAGDGKVGEHGAKVEEMFDGVHRHARPRANVCVAVVQSVEAVHQVRVQATVHPVEIKTLPYGDDEEDGDEPDWVGLERDDAGVAVGHGPPEEDFESGPDGDAAADGPNYVVFHLAGQREHTAVSGEGARVVF